MYFKKIKIDFPKIDYENCIKSFQGQFGSSAALSFYNLTSDIEQQILSVLPKDIQILNPWIFFAKTGKLTYDIFPHTDISIKATINHYISTAKAVTKFYNLKPNVISPKYQDGVHYPQGKIYSRSILDYNSEFTADENDTYILDVTQIHSVDSLQLPDIRKFLSIQFLDANFQSVSSAFN